MTEQLQSLLPFGARLLLATSALSLAAGAQVPGWQTLDTGVPDDFYGADFFDAQRGHAVGWGSGSGGVIASTVDGGATWTTTTPVAGSILFDVVYLDDQFGFAVGQGPANKGLVLRTNDGGATWGQQDLAGTFGLYDVDFTSPTTGWTCGWDGGIFKTDDAGASWTKQVAPGSANVTFRSLSFLDDQRGFALGGAPFGGSNRLYTTVDGGDTWVLTKLFGANTILTDIHFFDDLTGLAAGWRAGTEKVLRTTDGGLTWQVAHQGSSSQVLQAMSFRGRVGWAAGIGPEVHVTRDGGLTWASLPAPAGPQLFLGVCVVEGNVVLCGTAGQLHRLDTGG